MSAPRVAVLVDHDLPPNLADVEQVADVRVARADQLGDAVGGAEVLWAWDVRPGAVAAAWGSADRLRWVHTASAGVDNVLVPEVAASAVTVTNSRGVFDTAMAEYVLALVLSLAKDLAGTRDRQHRQLWEHRDAERVDGAAALVVGVGPIGRAIARLLRAVGMRVSGVGRTARSEDADFGRVAAVSDLARLLPEADYVVLAAPLTAQTRGFFGAAELAAMRPTARLINVGRGELVVEAELVDALAAGRIRGAALDVFDREPLPPSSPLWTLPGVLVSPHMAGDTVGWRAEVAEVFLDNLRRWRAGEPLRNVVDKDLGYVPSAACSRRAAVSGSISTESP